MASAVSGKGIGAPIGHLSLATISSNNSTAVTTSADTSTVQVTVPNNSPSVIKIAPEDKSLVNLTRLDLTKLDISITPDANATPPSLGAASTPFGDLFLSGNTLHLQDRSITIATIDGANYINLGSNVIVGNNYINSTSKIIFEGSFNLSDLGDANTNGITDGQFLKYNASSQQFEPSNASYGSLSSLSDVSIPGSLSQGQVLAYNSSTTKFEPTSNIASNLDDLGNVDTSRLTNGSILEFNSSSQKFETNSTVSNLLSTKLSIGGGTLSGNVSFGNNYITNLATPVSDTDAATKAYVDSKITSTIDSAPEALDTLNELAAALGDDSNFSTTITNQLADKAANTYVNQQLNLKASNSYVNEVKNQFTNSVNALDSAKASNSYVNSILPDSTSDLINDSNFITLTQVTNTHIESLTLDYSSLSNKPTLFSGSYDDLTDKPTLFSGNYNHLTNKPTLFSGSYDDLTDKPTLFSGNYNDLVSKPSIPTNTSDLYNDTNFASLSDVTDSYIESLSVNYSSLSNKPSSLSNFSNDLNISSFNNDSDYANTSQITNTITKAYIESKGISYSSLSNKPSIPVQFSDLSNVTFESLANGDFIYYDGSNAVFKNRNIVYGDIDEKPTRLSDFTNDLYFANTNYVDTAVADIVGGAPGALDTLNELAAALNDDENFGSSVTNDLATKASNTYVNQQLDLKATNTYVNEVKTQFTDSVNALDAAKASNTYVNNLFNTKADANLALGDISDVSNTAPTSGQLLEYSANGLWTPIDNIIGTKASNSYVNTQLALKATNTYVNDIQTQLEGSISTLSSSKASNTYVNQQLDLKATNTFVNTIKTDLDANISTLDSEKATKIELQSNVDDINANIASLDSDKASNTYVTEQLGLKAPISFNLQYISNVSNTSPTINQILQFTGTEWEPVNSNTVIGGSSSNGSSTLTDLTDTQISGTPTNGHALVYNSSAGKWIPAAVTASGTLSGQDIKDLLENADGQVMTSNTVAAATQSTYVGDSFSINTLRSAKYVVTINDTDDTTYYIAELLLVHNGNTVTFTLYGETVVGDLDIYPSYSADIDNSNVRLLITTTSDSQNIKILRQGFKI